MTTKAATKVAIIYYSTYGHVKTLAASLAEGVKAGGVDVTIFRVPETLPEDILKKMGAPKKDGNIPIATADKIKDFDGILFGTPTRFGMCSAQMKAFLDSTGGLWMGKALVKKTAGVFFSTGSQSGGQETTALTFLTQIAHHGMIWVPQGYTHESIGNNDVVQGGSPYGPGTIAGGDGSKQPSEAELAAAIAYGTRFANVTSALKAGGFS